MPLFPLDETAGAAFARMRLNTEIPCAGSNADLTSD